MIRRDALLLGLSAVLALSTTSSFALDRALTPEEQQLIQAIQQHNNDIRTMVGRFLQIDTNGGRTEGTFFLERPNKVAFRYAPPSREEIVSVGARFLRAEPARRDLLCLSAGFHSAASVFG